MKPVARQWSGWTKPALEPLMLALVALVLPRAAAQQVKLPDPAGTQIFRRILYDMDCTPLTTLSLLRSPADKVLIVLGDATVLDRLQEGQGPLPHFLRDFVAQGGSALVASDRAAKGPSLKNDFGTAIHEGPVKVAANSAAAYMQDKGLFILLARDMQIFRDLDRVAAVQPGYLLFVPPFALKLYAQLPGDAQINGENISPRQPAFAAGNDRYGAKEGRILILADHSLFSNALLWQRQGDAENHNFEFAEACASWLTESGKRKQVLFIEHGDIVDNFYTKFIEEPAPPMPPIEDVVHAVNQGLYGVQEENRFNDWIAGLADDVRPRNVIVILTVLLTAYGLLRLGQAKHHVDPNVPLLATGLAQLVPSVGLVSQRKRWMLREGNFAEVAQTLARQLFEAPEAERGPLPLNDTKSAARPPQVHSTEGWWQARRARREVRRLWKLAYAEQAREVSLRQLTTLQGTIKRLRSALAHNSLRIEGLTISERTPATYARAENL